MICRNVGIEERVEYIPILQSMASMVAGLARSASLLTSLHHSTRRHQLLHYQLPRQHIQPHRHLRKAPVGSKPPQGRGPWSFLTSSRLALSWNSPLGKKLLKGAGLVALAELVLVFVFYRQWRRINREQEYRRSLAASSWGAVVLEAYYTIGETIDKGNTIRAHDLQTWEAAGGGAGESPPGDL